MNNTDYKQFLVDFNSTDIPALYSDWQWLIPTSELTQPIAMNCFGDLFYKHSDGSIYFLDTLEGEVVAFAKDVADMQAKLSDTNNQNLFLSSENVLLLRERDQSLKVNELYIYTPHPRMSGVVDFNSIKIMSMNVALTLNGQLLGQVIRQQ